MSTQNERRTSDVGQDKGSSSDESSQTENEMSSSHGDKSGRQEAARSGTTPLGNEADESGKPEPGGVEGTGGLT